MTPTDVVHEMAFDSSPTRPKHCPSFEPLAPPPATAPPLPPPSEALQQPLPSSFSNEESAHSNRELPPSYQKEQVPRRAKMPRVTHYTTSSSRTSSYRGDASLRPNTGEVNSADGEALTEKLYKLQIINIVACIAAVLLEIPAFLAHVFTLHPARAVLGVYLIIFSLLLGLYELHTPSISSMLRDNFGILYHPLGRSLFLVIMGGLCMGQSWILFYILGAVFVLSAMDTLYCYLKFPQYRRMMQDHDSDLWMAAKNRASRYSWARPETIGLLVNNNASTAEDGSSGVAASTS